MVFFSSGFRGIRHHGGRPDSTHQFDLPIPATKKRF